MQLFGKKKTTEKNSIFNRLTIFLISVMIVFTILFVGLFRSLYVSAKNNIIQIQMNHVQSASAKISFYLDTAINAVTFSRQNIYVQHQNGASKEQLLESIIIMTDTFMSYIQDNIAGIYGYIYGDYLDGHAWTPDESYHPQERPWYTKAVKNPGELVYVSPYLDAESGQKCITLSQTLEDDSESVIAFDLSLASLQEKVNSDMQEENVVFAGILDRERNILIVSGETETPSEEQQKKERAFLKEAKVLKQNYTEIQYEGQQYLIFVHPLTGGWDYIYICDSSALFRKLKSLYFFAPFGILVFILVILLTLNRIKDGQKQFTQLLNLSERDALTGIYNRGSGESKISQKLENKTAGAFMMLDVDKFKSINDTYGHDTSDKVIIAVAHILEEASQKNDIVMRLGGDEFVVFLDGVCTRQEADNFTEKLFSLIDSAQIPDAPDLHLSVSGGIALYNGQRWTDFQELYQNADEKIYISKKISGNHMTF
ncbi:MAG: diguanylate cyclase [Oscillospiraceae bacterium]|nr:diguanylate cyclase [Oscillospiraceae bacterium]